MTLTVPPAAPSFRGRLNVLFLLNGLIYASWAVQIPAVQWRFRPGTRQGRAVPVIVTMEIAFALR